MIETARKPEKNGFRGSQNVYQGFFRITSDTSICSRQKASTQFFRPYLFISHTTVRMDESGLPHFAEGTVIKGFGRGSKELGIPTANLPPETIEKLPPQIDTGIYFGWANVDHGPVYKMVMSIGWNPYYKNKMKSMEVYLIHEFDEDFYGSTLRICMLGYIRPEMDFNSLDELLSTIKNDIRIAETQLDKPEFFDFKKDSFFKNLNGDSIKSDKL